MAEFLCPSILRLGYPYSDRYQALFRIFTSMSESSLRVIVLSSLVNPYPEFNTECANCIAHTLVNKVSNWINWSKKKGGGGERGQNHSISFTVKCSLHFHELLITLSTGFDSEFRQDVFTQEDYHYLNLPWLVQDIQCLSRYSMSTTALPAIFKELCHEIYQNSNKENCHQTEWKFK